MNQSSKMILSCVGVFIGGTGGYWQLHGDPGVLVTTPAFWIGFIMAGLVPLGAYFVGLVSKAPWEGPPDPTAGSTAAPPGGKP